LRAFVVKVFAEDAPKSCADCADAQQFRADPDSCFYDDGCPFESLGSRPDVAALYEFAMMSVESWESTNKLKQKEKRFGVNPERFRLACDLWGVPWGEEERSIRFAELPVRNARHAWTFAVAFAAAAQDAPQRKVVVGQPTNVVRRA